MIWKLHTCVADNPFHAECLKVADAIRKEPGNTISHSRLMKNSHLKAKELREVIETMEEAGAIEVIQGLKNGKLALSYRLNNRGL